VLTARGVKALERLGVDVEATQGKRRQFACRCLDWSERRDHLAGKLGSALLTHFIERGWLRRIGSERALELTPPGQQALAPLLATSPARDR
jgi:hypothetical protein